MIEERKYTATKEVLSALYERQGGGLFFNQIVGGVLKSNSLNYLTAAGEPKGFFEYSGEKQRNYKEFKISIYNDFTSSDVASLSLFINPKDLTIGQQQVVSNTYTRRGWVNAAWGNQQATLSSSGVSAGFYFLSSNKRGGLTNRYRRGSPGFINLMDLVGLFKNNGWYFLDGVSNPSLFKDGTSRVINVMDSIKIEYDGTSYIGSFSTFTLNDIATNPYRMEYSFEFIVSSFGLMYPSADGHLAQSDNQLDNQVHLGLQGSNIEFKTVLGLDTNELNRYFPAEDTPDPTNYDYSDRESRSEQDFFGKEGENDKYSATIAEGRFRITRGWLDGEPHGDPNMKCDFRTHTGTIYSATEGFVWTVRTSPIFGGSNYIIVQSEHNGVPIFVRYYHLEPSSIRLAKGAVVKVGTIIGREGTDNGKYPPHCDFGARIITGSNPNYLDCQEFQVNPLLNNMWKTLNPKAIGDNPIDPTFKWDFRELWAKHSAPGVTNEHKVTVT